MIVINTLTNILISILILGYLLGTDVGTVRLFDDEAGLVIARSRLDNDRCRFLAGNVRKAG